MLDRCRRPVSALLLTVAIPAFAAFAADKAKTKAEDTTPSYEQPQPQRETLDLNMYQRIREEGLMHSHIMEYASGLMDGIGPRLTGSPNLKRANEWTRDQFTAMGCSNAHLEDWGEFGMGWQQLNTWVRMTLRTRPSSSRKPLPGRRPQKAPSLRPRFGSRSRPKPTSRSTKASSPEKLFSSAICAK